MGSEMGTLDEIIDRIEAAYEFMLAYAAQGRQVENMGGDGPSIRHFLHDLETGLANIGDACSKTLGELEMEPGSRQQMQAFVGVLAEDAGRAGLAVKLVLSVSSISSQLIDNLNASTHLRSLLTDVFVLDEALKIEQRKPGQTALSRSD